jgi:hypothetical protein
MVLRQSYFWPSEQSLEFAAATYLVALNVLEIESFCDILGNGSFATSSGPVDYKDVPITRLRGRSL